VKSVNLKSVEDLTGAVKTDTANSKENTVKEEMGMTLLICLVYSDTNDGRGRRDSSYGRNTFFS
jgi:hypothetical protein